VPPRAETFENHTSPPAMSTIPVISAGLNPIRVTSWEARPAETMIPNVEGLDEASARQTLESSGFKVKVEDEPTTDPTEDGIVVGQDPPGDTAAKPNSKVTIFVGRVEMPSP
jgi:beta-lactam-binding protein with PASTA domain